MRVIVTSPGARIAFVERVPRQLGDRDASLQPGPLLAAERIVHLCDRLQHSLTKRKAPVLGIVAPTTIASCSGPVGPPSSSSTIVSTLSSSLRRGELALFLVDRLVG
jgi:hypothetical protein